MPKKNNTIYVRVAEHQQQFRKDLIEYGDKEGDENKRFRIDVQGWDELGRPVCPVYEVPVCKEVNDAIHSDFRRDPRPKTDPHYNKDGYLVPSRLVQVMDEDVENLPMWVGHPTLDMGPLEVYNIVHKIRIEQIKGDKIVEKISQPYSIPKPGNPTDPSYTFDKKLHELYEEGRKIVEGVPAKKEKEKEPVTA